MRRDPVGPRHPNHGAHERIHTFAHALDSYFRVPGTRLRFGLDPVLGLIPGAGDVIGGVFSSYIIFEAILAKASSAVLLRMVLNMGVDMLFSAIPLLGDIFDIGWRANKRNLRLLQRHLENPARAAAASKLFIVVVVLVVLGFLVGTLVLAAWALQTIIDALAR